MSITDGHQAIVSRIVSMATSANIVLPNGPGKSAPRYVVMIAGGMQRTRTVDGVTEAYPEVVVRVETSDQYATSNDVLVSELVARFPVGVRFGGVTIITAPFTRPPLPVLEGIYSVPVHVRGFMSF